MELLASNKSLIKEIINNISFNFPYTVDNWIENMYIENFHSHSSFSNTSIIDSPVSMEDYAKRIKELGTKCIYTLEHGNQGNQYEVYTIAEKENLKYVHSTEAYWVKDRKEKDSTNCHMCIIGLNEEGRKDINFALSMANIDGYYYKPRIDLELLLNIPKDNVIVTSACLAGWKYEDADEIWLKIADHFKENFFFEVQNHNTEKQKEINKHIIELAEKNNIQIICGLDSHYIDFNTDDVKREQILKYKKIKYEDEEGWYLDYPDGKEVFKRFKEQGILTDKQILTAMINTNIFIDKCQEIKFDREFKIPSCYPNTTYEERVEIFKKILNEEYKKDKLKSKEKIEGIRYEAEQIIDSGVVDYFLTNRKILKEAIENQGGVLTTTSRGSMASFIVNKLLGFTTIDRFNSDIPIYPERFLTKERVLSGQMPDCDFNIAEQEPFVKASRVIIGEESCYPLMAIEKLKTKAAWQLYAGANGVEPKIANEISKCIDSYDDKIKYSDEEDRQFIKPEDFIPDKYIELYKESLGYQGIVINLKVHACGHLLLEGDVRREIGLISAVSETTGKRTLCACIEGSYLDSFGFVKNDFLIVDSVSLIKECFDSIDQPVPTFEELKDLIKNDKLTWGVYEKGITCCINQCEKEKTTDKVKKYKPKTLAELSSFISAIRPGFASLLSVFLNREPYTTGEPNIDKLLQDSSHFMLFQESLMKVLSFLHLPMSETYGVIKSISKKKLKGEKKENLLKDLKKAWQQEFHNINNFNKVWQVIEDSARYSFNAPHAYSMGGDSAYLAYFKSHYPSKFYEVAINHYQLKDNKEKIDDLLREAKKFYGYKIGDYKYGDDNRKVNVNDENKIIYPNMTSIKNMQKVVPNILYSMKENKYEDIMYVFKDILNTEINKKSVDILIKINYFSDFGDINYILNQLEIYKEMKVILDKLNTCKQLKKEFCIEYNLPLDEVRDCCENETEKMFKDINNEKLVKVFKKHYKKIDKDISKKYPYTPSTQLDVATNQISLLGYTNIVDSTQSDDIYIIEQLETNNYGTPFCSLYHICNGESLQNIKIDRNWFKEYPCEVGDILKCSFKEKEKKRKNEDGKWYGTGKYETILNVYSKE